MFCDVLKSLFLWYSTVPPQFSTNLFWLTARRALVLPVGRIILVLSNQFQTLGMWGLFFFYLGPLSLVTIGTEGSFPGDKAPGVRSWPLISFLDCRLLFYCMLRHVLRKCAINGKANGQFWKHYFTFPFTLLK